MKNILLGLLLGLSLFLMSYNTSTKQQLCFATDDVNQVIKLINLYHKQGFIVKQIIPQSVSINQYAYPVEIRNGLLLVILEK